MTLLDLKGKQIKRGRKTNKTFYDCLDIGKKRYRYGLLTGQENLNKVLGKSKVKSKHSRNDNDRNETGIEIKPKEIENLQSLKL